MSQAVRGTKRRGTPGGVSTRTTTQTGGIVDAYMTVLRKYAVFEGRARRREYWMFFLINLLIGIVLGIADAALARVVGQRGFAIFGPLYSLAVLIPSLAVGVRRLHDTGRSGWWLLISFVPLIGFIVLIVFLVQQGQPGPNEYGPDPRVEGGAPSPAPRDAGWNPDPSGKHELRYWDSREWTDNVSDAGVTSVDPLNPRA